MSRKVFQYTLYLLPSRDMKQYFKQHALFCLGWDVVSMTTHPCIGSPILPLQGGDSRHSLEAAASENSALASLVPCTGKHRSPAELTLSCCFHAQAALALFGLTLLPILC